MTCLKIKGQEASSWLKMVTRKMKLEVLPDTVHKLSPPQARKNCFIWMGHLYGAFGPGTTCWPGGGSEMLSRGRGVKNGLQGGRMATYPPTPTYGLSKESVHNLQSIMNAKLSLHGFWHCHENGLIKTIQTIPHNLYLSFKSASLYWGLG